MVQRFVAVVWCGNIANTISQLVVVCVCVLGFLCSLNRLTCTVCHFAVDIGISHFWGLVCSRFGVHRHLGRMLPHHVGRLAQNESVSSFHVRISYRHMYKHSTAAAGKWNKASNALVIIKANWTITCSLIQSNIDATFFIFKINETFCAYPWILYYVGWTQARPL